MNSPLILETYIGRWNYPRLGGGDMAEGRACGRQVGWELGFVAGPFGRLDVLLGNKIVDGFLLHELGSETCQ